MSTRWNNDRPGVTRGSGFRIEIDANPDGGIVGRVYFEGEFERHNADATWEVEAWAARAIKAHAQGMLDAANELLRTCARPAPASPAANMRGADHGPRSIEDGLLDELDGMLRR